MCEVPGTVTGMNPVTVRAPARVTLFVQASDELHDGGYDKAALYQAVSLFDEVTAEHSEQDRVLLLSSAGRHLDEPDTTKVLHRVLGMLRQEVESGERATATPVTLTVQRRIPGNTGLGAVSADVAATLVACNDLWQARLSREKLADIAREIGPEVPFALFGGTAEHISTRPSYHQALTAGSYTWVLAWHPHHVRRDGWWNLFRRHRQRNRKYLGPLPTRVSVDSGVMEALRAGNPHMLANAMHNDFQAVIMGAQGAVRETLELGESSGAIGGIVSEGGGSVAFLLDDAQEAHTLRNRLMQRNCQSVVVTGPASGAKRVDAPLTGVIRQITRAELQAQLAPKEIQARITQLRPEESET